MNTEDSGSLPRRGWRFELPAILLLLLIATGFFWKLVLSDQFTWMESSDIAYQVLPWLQMQTGELHAGRVPALWDPYVYGGEPLLAQAQPGAAYPLNWLLFTSPTRRGFLRQRTLHWYFVLIHFLAILACYLACRDLGLSRGASIAGGSLYGLGGYMNQLDWPQMLNPAVWTPLVLLFVMRAATGRRPWGSAALGGLCLGAAWLGGHHQTPLYTSLMAIGVWIWIVFRRLRFDRAAAAQLALFLVIAGMVGALQILPAYEYSQNAYRWVNAPYPVTHSDRIPYTVQAEYGFKAHALLGFVLPNIQMHATGYIGVTAAVLALLGWALGWGRIEVRIAAFVAAGGVLYALGAEVLFHGIIYSLVPIVDKARNPSMAIIVCHAALALLAAFGIDAIGRAGEDDRWIARAKRGAVAFAFLIWAALLFLRREHLDTDAAFSLTALVAVLGASALHGWRTRQLGRSAAIGCLIALMLIELGNGPSSYYPHKIQTEKDGRLQRMSRDAELVTALRKLPQPYRTEVRTEDFPHNTGDLNGIEIYGGYLASLLRTFYDMEPHKERVRELYSVRYSVAPEPAGKWYREVFASKQGWKIWENPDAFPRVWTVHKAVKIAGKSEISSIIDNYQVDLRRQTFLYTEPPALETCAAADAVWLLRREATIVRAFVDMQCRGMVVAGDTFYPGWKAFVDGKEVPIHAAYTCLRGVVVDKGQHMIEFRYRPWTVYLGAVLTIAGLAAAAVVWRLDRSRDRAAIRG